MPLPPKLVGEALCAEMLVFAPRCAALPVEKLQKNSSRLRLYLIGWPIRVNFCNIIILMARAEVTYGIPVF